MLTRNDVLSRAVNDCVKELYSLAVPNIEWEDFVEQNKIYLKKYKEWEDYRRAEKEDKKLYREYNEKLGWEGKSIVECIGPRPYEFYYLPKEIFKDIVNNYVYAYKMDEHQQLLDIIEILKNYCKEPIKDKWIEDGNSGYRGYEYSDNLEKEIFSILKENSNYWKNAIGKSNPSDLSKEIQNKFFEFLDMAGKFFNWNSDLNNFCQTVYLGATPNSNKEAVIENWKKYRNQDIEIDEEQIKKDYYGEDFDE